MNIASKLHDYLQEILASKSLSSLIPDETTRVGLGNVSRLGGGMSNLVYSFSLVCLKNDEKRRLSLILRTSRSKSETKILKEFEILSALNRLNFPAPKVYKYETSSPHFGEPFLIMERVEGEEFGSCLERVGEEEALKLAEDFAKTVVQLHRIDWQRLELSRIGSPRTSVEYAEMQVALVKHLSGYLGIERELRSVIEWLRANARLSPSKRYTLVHGDLGPDNVMVDREGRIVFVDWEGTEVGDPAADVGYAYHFLKMTPVWPPSKRGKLAEHFVSSYLRNSGQPLPNLEFYKIVTALRLALFLRLFRSPVFAFKVLKAQVILLPIFYFLFIRPFAGYLSNFLERRLPSWPK